MNNDEAAQRKPDEATNSPAYLEGEHAWVWGTPLRDNPYPDETPEAKAWHQGWLDMNFYHGER
jgi:hypothetical protein